MDTGYRVCYHHLMPRIIFESMNGVLIEKVSHSCNKLRVLSAHLWMCASVSNKITRRNTIAKSRIRASAEELSCPMKQPNHSDYHLSKEISDFEESDENGDAILAPTETSRTGY